MVIRLRQRSPFRKRAMVTELNDRNLSTVNDTGLITLTLRRNICLLITFFDLLYV